MFVFPPAPFSLGQLELDGSNDGIHSQDCSVPLHACVSNSPLLAGTEWNSKRHRDWEEIYTWGGPHSLPAEPAGMGNNAVMTEQKGVAFEQWMTWLLLFFSAHRARINKEVHRRMWGKNRNRWVRREISWCLFLEIRHQQLSYYLMCDAHTHFFLITIWSSVVICCRSALQEPVPKSCKYLTCLRLYDCLSESVCRDLQLFHIHMYLSDYSGRPTCHPWDWPLRKAGNCEPSSAWGSRPSQFTYSHMTRRDAGCPSLLTSYWGRETRVQQ